MYIRGDVHLGSGTAYQRNTSEAPVYWLYIVAKPCRICQVGCDGPISGIARAMSKSSRPPRLFETTPNHRPCFQRKRRPGSSDRASAKYRAARMAQQGAPRWSACRRYGAIIRRTGREVVTVLAKAQRSESTVQTPPRKFQGCSQAGLAQLEPLHTAASMNRSNALTGRISE
jgi:hypothetical protein